MLGNPEYDGFLEKVERLVEAGITIHGQVVLCPDWNDGEHLERTIDGHGEAVSGRRFPRGCSGRSYQSPKESSECSSRSRRILPGRRSQHVSAIQRKLKKKLGTPFVFLGDEIYIMADGAPSSASATIATFLKSRTASAWCGPF